MKKKFVLGSLFGLKLSSESSVLPASLILWAALAAVGFWVLDLSLFLAVMGGLLATLLHLIGGLWHQFGHALAARQSGFPMVGVQFWWWFSRSIYPDDEPALPAAVHIRRALGGPPASLLLSIFLGVFAYVFRTSGGFLYWVLVFTFLDNFVIFSLGPFIPLGFTDGSTILYWKRNRPDSNQS